MDSFSADMESGVESELIDLGAVSMTALRELDDRVFRQALRHVMQQTEHPRVSSGAGSAERVD
jgi:FXSXX-COOH protein